MALSSRGEAVKLGWWESKRVRLLFCVWTVWTRWTVWTGYRNDGQNGEWRRDRISLSDFTLPASAFHEEPESRTTSIE